jgi:3-deoxy-D-manno-octulosonic-acid transferase
VFAAGSTHPGEEEIVLNVFKRLRAQFSDLSLILAPRHVERAAEVEALIRSSGFSYERFSNIIRPGQKANDIILVDTIGHLRDLYSYATVVFVGKSILGVGGQNIIEPLSFGKPVVVGPHMENFRAIMDLFFKAKAVVVVHDEKELGDTIQDLLDHPNRAVELGINGRSVIQSQQGAVARTLSKLQSFFM